MTMDTPRRIRVAALSACLVLCAAAAFAQTRTGQQGPLVLQPTGDGPVLAPEVKVGWFDGKAGTLLGGYGGWMFDNRILFGAAFDVLVDHNFHDPLADLWYTGFLAGWSTPANRMVQAGVRGLVGFGEATVTDSFTVYPPYANFDHHPVNYPPPGGPPIVQQVRFHDGIFVFEPQGTLAFRLSRMFAIDVAGGYRVISGMGHSNSRVQGASASVGVRFGPGI